MCIFSQCLSLAHQSVLQTSKSDCQSHAVTVTHANSTFTDIAINVVRCVSDLNVVFGAQRKQDAKASTTNKIEFCAFSINTLARQA